MSLTLLLLIAFFVGSVLLQRMSGKDFCAMCVSVSLTWLTLLVLYYFFYLNSYQIDPMILGILMGGSVVGLVYYLFKDRSRLQIFKFPFLVSLFWLIYLLIGAWGWRSETGKEFLIIGILWFVFILIYLFNKNGYWKEWGQRIIECCRNW